MKNERLETYQESKNLIKAWKIARKRFGVKERVFGRWTGADRSREIEEMRNGSQRENIYTFNKSQQIQVSRGIEESIEVGIEKMVVDSWGIEQVSSNKESDPRTEARSIHQVSRSYRGGRSILDRSTRYRGAFGIAIRKRFRKLDR